MSIDAYLAFEREAAEKHQYVAGEVFAMAGASPRHNGLVANLVMLAGQSLAGKPCRVFPSDLKVHVPAFELFTYSDASIVCGPLALYGETTDVVTNPRVLFEVLSESTERCDRGDKAEGYRSIPSLTDYLLIAQQKAHVEHYARQDDGSWVLREAGPGGVIEVGALALRLAVDALYAGAFELPS
jgi:Uma2 family endonuclease